MNLDQAVLYVAGIAIWCIFSAGFSWFFEKMVISDNPHLDAVPAVHFVIGMASASLALAVVAIIRTLPAVCSCLM